MTNGVRDGLTVLTVLTVLGRTLVLAGVALLLALAGAAGAWATEAAPPDEDSGVDADTTSGVVVEAGVRVVGGARASTDEHSWAVFLTDAAGFQFCGGTLVAPTKVVTAAHCMATTTAPQVKVVA